MRTLSVGVLLMLILQGFGAPIEARETEPVENAYQHQPVDEEQSAEEGHDQDPGEGEEHSEGHFHKNHIALFLGVTEGEFEHGQREDVDNTIGFDYERRLNKRVGVGVIYDYVAEGDREALLGVPIFLHFGKSAKIQIAPSVQEVRADDDYNFVIRTGFIWDFFVGKRKKYTVSPAIFYDAISNGEDFLVLGVNLGMGF